MWRPLTFSVAGVIVCHYVYPQDSGQVVEPIVYHAEIFGIPVRKQNCDVGVRAFYEKCGDAAPCFGVEPEVARGMEVRGSGRLEEEGADHITHVKDR